MLDCELIMRLSGPLLVATAYALSLGTNGLHESTSHGVMRGARGMGPTALGLHVGPAVDYFPVCCPLRCLSRLACSLGVKCQVQLSGASDSCLLSIWHTSQPGLLHRLDKASQLVSRR